MAENKIVGSLVLRTIDIEPTRFNPTNNADTVENNFGICDARGSFVTWKNVNIRQCLGGLYHKYRRFNLKMTSVQMRYNQFTACENAQVIVFISGLPFSSYNTRLDSNNKAALGCVSFRIPNAPGGGITSFTSGLVSFDKPLQDNLNISIEFKSSRATIYNGYREGMSDYTGHYSIVCDIYGIDEPSYILSHYNMVENKSVGSLVLRTIDIEPTRTRPTPSANQAVNNDFGICDANGGYVTWKNVNIRECLGGLYNKYDRFNLKMTCAQIRHNNTTGSNEDAQFVIYISGLPFSSGSTYNTRLGPNNKAALGCVNFRSDGANGVTTSFTSGLVSFDKPLQDTLNISIELKNSSTVTSNGYSEASANFLGHYSIVCDIYGIDKK